MELSCVVSHPIKQQPLESMECLLSVSMNPIIYFAPLFSVLQRVVDDDIQVFEFERQPLTIGKRENSVLSRNIFLTFTCAASLYDLSRSVREEGKINIRYFKHSEKFFILLVRGWRRKSHELGLFT